MDTKSCAGGKDPAVQFLTAMIYKSGVDGFAKLDYPDSTFLRKLNFKNLYSEDKPYLFHNAWNLSSATPSFQQ